ncbi:hypothetical protein GCM10010360_40630 [Streptomyces nogalater]
MRASHVTWVRNPPTMGAGPRPPSPSRRLSPRRQPRSARLCPDEDRAGESGRRASATARPAGGADLVPSTAPARYGPVTTVGKTGFQVFGESWSSHPESVTAQTIPPPEVVAE